MLPLPEKITEQRIQETILRALRIPSPDPSTPLRMGSTPGWDSMAHMNVVMELEKEFGARFPPYQLPELVDIPSITRTLRSQASK
jgi:acyl carrier protein